MCSDCLTKNIPAAIAPLMATKPNPSSNHDRAQAPCPANRPVSPESVDTYMIELQSDEILIPHLHKMVVMAYASPASSPLRRTTDYVIT